MNQEIEQLKQELEQLKRENERLERELGQLEREGERLKCRASMVQLLETLGKPTQLKDGDGCW